MVDVSIREQPESDFAGIDVLDQLAEFWIGLDDFFQGQCIVNFAVVLQSVDFVVANKTFDSETILSIVSVVKLISIFAGETKVIFEELVYCVISEVQT